MRIAVACTILLAPYVWAQGGEGAMSAGVPKLSVEQVTQGDRTFTMVNIELPGIPNSANAIWCYEDAFAQGQGEPQADGSLVLRHKRPDGAEATTHFIPREGVVEFHVRITGPTPEVVKSVGGVNPCWQLRKSEAFGNRGNFPEDFVARCFIFTERGFTLLKDTKRFPDTRKPADDKYNTPPWVQVYVPLWRKHPGQPQAFWGNSTDRFAYSLIGVVSHDGQWLAAIGCRKSRTLAQGWHDCLHPNPDFTADYDAAKNETNWLGRLYFLPNDPAALLARYQRDFEPEEPVKAP
jgi:hypothetical protein